MDPSNDGKSPKVQETEIAGANEDSPIELNLTKSEHEKEQETLLEISSPQIVIDSPRSGVEIMDYGDSEDNLEVKMEGELLQDEYSKARKMSIEEIFADERKGILVEMKSITIKALPLMIGGLFSAFTLFLETSTIGKLGKKQLAGYGMAHIFVVFLGYPLKFGIIGALETLCSQAHTGMKHTNMTEIYLQRAIALFVCLMVFNFGVWTTSPLWLSRVVKDKEIAFYAGRYLQLYIPGFFSLGLLGCIRQYLYAQGIVKPIYFVAVIGSSVTILSLYVLVINKSTSIGFIGVPISSGLGYLTMLSILIMFVRSSKLKSKFKVLNPIRNFFPLNYISKDVFMGWDQILKFAIPSMILVYTTSGTNELASVAATMMKDNALAVQSVLNTVTRLFIMFFINFAIISTNRMGNALGANVEQRARIIFKASTIIFVLIAIVIFIFLISAANWWGPLFSKNKNIVGYIEKLAPLVAVTMVFEIIGFLYTGLLRGQGRQVQAAKIKIFAFYLVGTPIGWILGLYFGWNLKGLWIGLIIGHSITTITMGYIMYNTDWKVEIQKCRDRLQGNAKSDYKRA
ncbi:hypothetical protein BB559_006127 [Furculomyces boomerangus]|uniref:Polysaccharide biosynthesis protein C-terminal domain-containing protein n=1 Tax=Furculomyces boomerangus TaxID=61424 RepID=A0A2T9Y4M0_9FUNG|nr:hypothetical protein BB559_006127 [Furculomyces boomerangus]